VVCVQVGGEGAEGDVVRRFEERREEGVEKEEILFSFFEVLERERRGRSLSAAPTPREREREMFLKVRILFPLSKSSFVLFLPVIASNEKKRKRKESKKGEKA
jgi:hypothetical protein